MATTLTIRFKGVMAGLKQTKKRYRASDHLREHIARFNKSLPEFVKIDPSLNDFMMSRVVSRGSKVKVEVSKTGEIINARLAPGQVPAKQDAPKPTAAAKPAVQPAQKKQATAQQPQAKAEAKKAPADSAQKADRPKKEGKKQQEASSTQQPSQ